MRTDLYSILPLCSPFASVFAPSEGHVLRGEDDERGLDLVLSRRSNNFSEENDVCLSSREIFYQYRGYDDCTVHVYPVFRGMRLNSIGEF